LVVINSINVFIHSSEVGFGNNSIFGTSRIGFGVNIKWDFDCGTLDFFGNIFDEVEGKEDGSTPSGTSGSHARG